MAKTGREAFLQYYSVLIPGIKSILYETNLIPELTLYRGKAIECVGLIAESVGINAFKHDALEIMDYLMQSLVRY